jgi:hypothetical protein
MDLDQFVSENAPQEGGEGFQLESSKLLDVTLDGSVMAKAGTMVAYTGDVSFERKSGGGLSGMLKKKVTGEGSVMMQASGTGHVYLADQGKEVQVLELDAGEEISVNGNDVLAFESSVGWDIRMMDSIAGTSTGGMFNVFHTVNRSSCRHRSGPIRRRPSPGAGTSPRARRLTSTSRASSGARRARPSSSTSRERAGSSSSSRTRNGRPRSERLPSLRAASAKLRDRQTLRRPRPRASQRARSPRRAASGPSAR